MAAVEFIYKGMTVRMAIELPGRALAEGTMPKIFGLLPGKEGE